MSTQLIFISVAARMLDMHPQTLRKYERLGLVQPARTIGSMRLYSAEEIARLRLIKELVEDAGVNLAGVQRLLAVAEGLQRLEPLLDDPALRRRAAPPVDPRSAAPQGGRRSVSMEFRDYYKTLGVAKTASAKEIKQAFRRLARKHHPDVNPGDTAAETTFKELNEAYEVLGNPGVAQEVRRARRQLAAVRAGRAGRRRRAWAPRRAAPAASYRTMTPEEMEELFGGGGSPFSDFFNTFFGGQAERPRARGPAARGRPRRAPAVEYDIALDLEAALGGRVERVTVPGDEARTLEVRIPAGVSDGTRLTAGDLHLRVRLKPHPRFERQGRDLTTQALVPVTTAVLGGTVDVVTLCRQHAHGEGAGRHPAGPAAAAEGPRPAGAGRARRSRRSLRRASASACRRRCRPRRAPTTRRCAALKSQDQEA